MSRIIIWVLVGAVVGFFAAGYFGFGLGLVEGGMLGVVVGGILGALLAFFINKKSAAPAPQVQTSQFQIDSSTIAPIAMAPRWLIMFFKTLGILILVVAVFSSVVPITSLILSGTGMFVWTAILPLIVFTAVSLIAGFGAWYMKKWLLPVLSLMFVINLGQLIFSILRGTFGTSSVIYLVIVGVLLFIVYKYRNFFTGNYINYPILACIAVAYLAEFVLLARMPSPIHIEDYYGTIPTSTVSSGNQNQISLMSAVWKTCISKDPPFGVSFPSDWTFSHQGPESGVQKMAPCTKPPGIPFFTIAPEDQQLMKNVWVNIEPIPAMYKSLNDYLKNFPALKSEIVMSTSSENLNQIWMNEQRVLVESTIPGGRLYELTFSNLDQPSIVQFLHRFFVL